MDYITVTAKNLDDAITEALVQLEVTSDRLDYEVIEKGSDGFLGFGRKQAVIKARRKEEPVVEVKAEKKEEKPVKVEQAAKVEKTEHAEKKELVKTETKNEFKKEHKKEITDENILEKISEANKQRVHIAKSKSGIVVKGINDMAVRFSKCCNPVPGDEIVGFVTRGRGMSIHRTDCINIINLSDVERSRLITAEWEENDQDEGGQYLAELKIFADDRRGLLLDVSKVFTEEKIDVKSMNTRTSKKGTATMEMGFVVHGREELNRVIGKLRQIENVIDIERTTG
mgnify:CR=1 FL=1